MSMYRKLTTVAAVAALAFGLAACGGGGGGNGDTGMQMPPPTPPAPTPVAVTVPDAMYLDEDNAPMAGSMSIAAGDSYTNNGVTFSCPAGGDACEVEVMDDGTATSTGGEAMAALTDDAMVQVAQAKQAAAAAAAEELRDRIIGKDQALESASNILQTTGTANTLEEADIVITRGAGKMASVRVADPAGYSVSDDPALPNPGWAGTHLTRSIAGATQHLFVYTDIAAPTRIQFYNWDGDATTPSRYADTVTDALAIPATAATVRTPLSLVAAGTAVPALFNRGNLDGNFNSPGPAEGGNAVQRFRGSANGAGAGVGGITFQGNFNGAAGTYICTAATGTDCSVTITPTGTYTSPDGWTFTPELNSTAWLQDGGTAQFAGTARQVGEFMSFGWWLQEPASSDGTYTFQYYADGTAYTVPAAITTGTATYTGRAAGKYVVQEIDDTGVTGGNAGMFTAAATLNASFGAAANSISGSISGFASDNADVDVSGWSVTLHRKALGALAGNTAFANFPVRSQPDPTRPGYNGVTATMGDQTAHGDWTGQFFGDANAGNTRNAYPLGVGGTFQADNESVNIAGAFGARR